VSLNYNKALVSPGGGYILSTEKILFLVWGIFKVVLSYRDSRRFLNYKQHEGMMNTEQTTFLQNSFSSSLSYKDNLSPQPRRFAVANDYMSTKKMLLLK